jgi:protein-disulfide isomerase
MKMRKMLKYLGVTSLVVLLTVGTDSEAKTGAKPPEPSGKVADLKITDKDYALGPKDAKIVLVEYASLTCTHCAQFHTQVLPGLKKEFIDTGKIRYIYRDFPLDRLALAAAMIGRCAGRENFIGFIDAFYNTQGQWARSSNPINALAKLARLGGMNQTKFDRCLKDVEIQNVILRQRLEAVNDFKVQTTPTVFVNGDRYTGGMSLDQFRTLLNGMAAK